MVTDELVPLLEKYALEQQANLGPPTWVMDSLLAAGVTPEVLMRILDDMYWRNEVPLHGSARKVLIRDSIFVADKWFTQSMRSGRGFGAADRRFKPEMVMDLLMGYARDGLAPGEERERLERLVAEIKKRFGLNGP